MACVGKYVLKSTCWKAIMGKHLSESVSIQYYRHVTHFVFQILISQIVKTYPARPTLSTCVPSVLRPVVCRVSVSCVVCPSFCVHFQCLVFCVLCLLSVVLCPASCALRPVSCIPYPGPLSYVLCPVSGGCQRSCVLRPVPCVLCHVSHVLDLCPLSRA